jgi:hypothetical protein
MTDAAIPPNYTVYAVREVDREQADKTRAEIVRYLLQQTIARLKTELDPASWVNTGWAELESFIEALHSGGLHAALQEWEAAKGGHPKPLSRERYARHLVVLLCKALERAKYNKRKARKFAARELAAARVFDSAPSHRTIEYWQEEEPELTHGDEMLIATGFATSNGHPDRLAIYFIGLCHLTLNPTAVVIRESSGKGGDYLRSLRLGTRIGLSQPPVDP